MYLWEGEWQILQRLVTAPGSVLHPFTLLPLLGQVVLLITLFQRQPSRWLTYLGIAGIGLLLVLMFMIGLIGANWKILLFSLPFLVVAVFTLVYHRRQARPRGEVV